MVLTGSATAPARSRPVSGTAEGQAVKKLKIAYFIDTYSPGAGTENQLMGLLHNLDPRRVAARLFTLRGEFPAAERETLPWPVECLDVRSLLSLGGFRRFWRLVARLRRERFDIVMIYFLDANLFVVPACFLAGVKCCVINRRDMGYWYEPGILRRLGIVNRLASYFLVNSEAIKERVVAVERFPAKRIKVIYNGLWQAPPAAAPEEPDRLDLPPDAPVVGIVANLRPVKRVDLFVEMAALVARELPTARFLVLGQGELAGRLQQQAAAAGLGEQVHFLGQVRDVFPYLARLDVGVLTSESEGLSNCLIEYGRAGVPTVAFDTGGNREIVRDGQNGFLVPPGDVSQLAGRVLEILTDTRRSEQMRAAGPRVCAELFDPGKVLAQTMEFYEAIAAAPRKGWRDGPAPR